MGINEAPNLTTTNEPTNLELAAKFVADKCWRWLPGIRTTSGHRCVTQFRDGADVVRIEHEVCLHTDDIDEIEDLLPDVEDHATIGCIEHGIVPEALQDPDACLCFNPLERAWHVYSPKNDACSTSQSTKQAALLAALNEADDIKRRSTAGHASVQVEDFGDADEFDGRDSPDYNEPFDDDSDDRSRAPRYLDSPDEVPTDPKLCTRPAPAQTVAARGFLDALRQRDAEREAQRRAKLRGEP